METGLSKVRSYFLLLSQKSSFSELLMQAIQFFDDNAKPSERFKFTLDRVGLDKFEKVIKEAYNG